MLDKIVKLLDDEKIRFISVGFINTFLDFILLNLFTSIFGIYFVISNILSVSVCISISFLLNHSFVFKKKTPVTIISFATFFAVTGFSSLALQSFIITSMHWMLGTPFSRSLVIIGDLSTHPIIELNFIKAVAVLIGMVWNFFFYKHVVFKDKPAKTDAEFIG